jgi:hypothetical protein
MCRDDPIGFEFAVGPRHGVVRQPEIGCEPADRGKLGPGAELPRRHRRGDLGPHLFEGRGGRISVDAQVEWAHGVHRMPSRFLTIGVASRTAESQGYSARGMSILRDRIPEIWLSVLPFS